MEQTPTMPMAMALVTTLILVLSNVLYWRSRRKALNLPPGPCGWPVLGSLGALAGALPPHRALAALAARHGPLMHLRLGSYHAVVASSADAARLVLKTHDLAFADRPPTTAGEHVAYGYRGVLHTPHGAYWRMARRLCATELFSGRRVDSYEYIRRQEVRALIRGLFRRGASVSATWASLGLSQDPAHKEDMDYIYKGGRYTRVGLDRTAASAETWLWLG